MKQLLGCISFGNTREGLALETLHDALRDKTMWMLECEKKDEEIGELKKTLEEWREQAMKYEEIIRDLQKGIRDGKRKRKKTTARTR